MTHGPASQRLPSLLLKLVGLKRQQAERDMRAALIEKASIQKARETIEAALQATSLSTSDFESRKLAFENGFVRRAIEQLKQLGHDELAADEKLEAARRALRETVHSEEQLKAGRG